MSDVVGSKPVRKSMFLGPDALANLKVTAARRRTEREAVEEGLELLAARDAQRDAIAQFVEWATAQWGAPSAEDRARADAIWASR